MITLKEIADICGVSPATVSNILNGKPKVSEETKQRVLEVVRKTNYQPDYSAQNMRRKKTYTIGIITEDLMEFSAIPIVETIIKVCEEWKYRTVLINMRLYDKWGNTWYRDDEKIAGELQPALREMQSYRVDGIIYVAGHCREIKGFPADFSIPVLVAYGLSKDEKYTSVILDDEEGAHRMTAYLLSQGHTRVGVIAGAPDNHHTRQRLAGYRRALEEADIACAEELVRFGNWNRSSGYREMEELMGAEPTAVFCFNDLMAAGAYDCLREHQVGIGREISVVGYDNREMSSYLSPLLTTCDLQLEEVGRRATELLLEQVSDQNATRSREKIIKIQSRIIFRNSVEARQGALELCGTDFRKRLTVN